MIRAATPEDAALVAGLITLPGREELRDVYDMTPEQAAAHNLENSSEAWIITAGDSPLALLGVAPLSILGNSGELWCLGTVHICRHELSFARQCRRFLPSLYSRWRELRVAVDRRQPDVVAWVKWLGAKVEPMDKRMNLAIFGGS